MNARQSMFPAAPRTVTRPCCGDVEAPDYDQSRAFMTARQGDGSGDACEVKAHDFFDAALAHVTDPEVRTLFEELPRRKSSTRNWCRRSSTVAPDSRWHPTRSRTNRWTVTRG